VRIAAEGVVPAAPEAVFRFLSELDNHWSLAGRWVEVVSLNGSDGGRVRIHGPLGLRRTATTRVVDAQPDHVMHGVAELSGGTRAQIAWELNEDAGGTAVRLSAQIERASFFDRILIALGGGRWMRRRFVVILARLRRQFS
jgi:hypothetical protein